MLFPVSGGGSWSVYVLGARRVCSCAVVRGVVLLVSFLVPFVCVFVWLWCVCSGCVSDFVCV